MNLLLLRIVGVVLLMGATVGCQEEPKFSIPDDPAPWSPDLMPSGGGGGGGKRGTPAKGKEAEKESKESAEPNNSTGEVSDKPADKAVASEGGQQGGSDQSAPEKQGSDAKSSDTKGNDRTGEDGGQL